MRYCATTDILNLIPPQISKAITDPDIIEKPVDNTMMLWYIEYASNVINSIIGQQYVVPLSKIIIVDKATLTETEQYPYPITDITAMLATAYIYKKLYSESQNPQELPKYSEDYQTQGTRLLNQILSGAMPLKGQRQLSRRYLRPESMNVNRLPIDIKDLELSK